jgi:hypothetical protein
MYDYGRTKVQTGPLPDRVDTKEKERGKGRLKEGRWSQHRKVPDGRKGKRRMRLICNQKSRGRDNLAVIL